MSTSNKSYSSVVLGNHNPSKSNTASPPISLPTTTTTTATNINTTNTNTTNTTNISPLPSPSPSHSLEECKRKRFSRSYPYSSIPFVRNIPLEYIKLIQPFKNEVAWIQASHKLYMLQTPHTLNPTSYHSTITYALASKRSPHIYMFYNLSKLAFDYIFYDGHTLFSIQQDIYCKELKATYQEMIPYVRKLFPQQVEEKQKEFIEKKEEYCTDVELSFYFHVCQLFDQGYIYFKHDQSVFNWFDKEFPDISLEDLISSVYEQSDPFFISYIEENYQPTPYSYSNYTPIPTEKKPEQKRENENENEKERK